VAGIVTLIVDSLVERVHGPMSLRLYIQPIMAAVFAVRSGLRDAREGKPPYFWSLFTLPEHRRDLLREGWKSIGKVFVIAAVLDAIYQFSVQGFIYPVEVFVIAFILAILPYLILRGAVTRIVRWLKAA